MRKKNQYWPIFGLWIGEARYIQFSKRSPQSSLGKFTYKQQLALISPKIQNSNVSTTKFCIRTMQPFRKFSDKADSFKIVFVLIAYLFLLMSAHSYFCTRLYQQKLKICISQQQKVM